MTVSVTSAGAATEGLGKLRITLVGPLPPPAGGMANQTVQLRGLLETTGAAVRVIQVNAPYRPAWCGKVKGLRAAFRLLPYVANLVREARRTDLFHVMANSGWSWHLYAAPAVWIARVFGVPVVLNYRGGEAEAFFARSAAFVRPTMRRADAVVVPSGFLESVFAQFGFRAQVVPNIVDLGLFRPPSEPRTGSGSPHLVVTRHLEPIYDIGTALRAFAQVRSQIPGARLSVAGTGPELAALEALAQSLGIANAVRFTGQLDREGVAALYRSADVVLNPSVVDNMPNSVLEALACGVPVVSTDVGGVPYLLSHGRTGLLVPPRNPEAMAAAVRQLLAEPALAARLADAGLREVRQYGWEHVRDRWIGTYRRCTSPPRRTPTGVPQ